MRPAYITVTGIKGGTGRTTLAAQLGHRLLRAGYAPMCFDLCADNMLGLHFGMAPGETVGISDASLTRRRVADYLRRINATASRSDPEEPEVVSHVPFGPVEDGAAGDRFWAALRADPDFLRSRIEALRPPRCRVVLMDLPLSPPAIAQAGLGLSDCVLVPMLADAASFATLPGMEARLLQGLGPDYAARSAYVINAFDASRMLSRDVRSAMRAVLGDRLLAFAVHADESVREALARRTTLDAGGGTSVNLDLEQLTRWAIHQMEKSEADAETRRSARA